jgi:cob(I)alamin adenosyltransferase
VAVTCQLLTENELLGFMDLKPDNVELVITGRDASAAVITRADLVTEMKEIKHYYHQGVTARKGIEK